MSHPEDENDSGSQRYKRVDLQQKVSLKFKEFQGFITEYSENLSAGGMFIRTDEPQAPGSIFDFEFTLGEDYTLIHGLGEVVWVRDEDEGFDRPAGMGVRFLSLDEKSRDLIDRMVAERLAAQKARAAEPITPDLPWGMTSEPSAGTAPPAERGAALPAAEAAEDETVAEGVPSWLPSPATGPEGEGGGRPSLFDMLPDPERERPTPAAAPVEGAEARSETEESRRQVGPSPYARSYPVAGAQVAVRSSRSRGPWLAIALVALAVVAVAAGAVLFFPASMPHWLPWAAGGQEQAAPGDGEQVVGAEQVPDTEDGAEDGAPQGGAEDATPVGEQAGAPEEPVVPSRVGAPEPSEAGGGETAGVMGMVGEGAEEDGALVGAPVGAEGATPKAQPAERQASAPARPGPGQGAARRASPEPPSRKTVPVPPAPEEEPFTRVLNITWEQLEGELLVTIYLDGSVREWDYSHVRVGSPPPRELVIIRGVREPFARKNIPVAAAMLDQIRVGFHPKRGGNELHVVLDVARPTVYLERMEASDREIRLYVTVREQ